MSGILRKNIGWVTFIAVLLYFIGRYFYTQPKYINGAVAPNFTATMLNGQSASLNDVKGNFVLLDFWGSWCGPCIAEAPELKNLYEKYHGKAFKEGKGFEIFSVGIESEKARWEQAIQKLGLNWTYHVSDFQNLNSPLATLYGVRVIPTKFLINTEGVIVGVNQSIEDIDKYLANQLK